MFMISLVGLGFTACSKDDGGDDGKKETSLSTPAHENDAVKYNITSSNSDISSIEFTESGNYIIMMKRTSTYTSRAANEKKTVFGVKNNIGITRASNYIDYYGKYTKNGDTYILENFGTVKVIKNGDIAVSLELTPTGRSSYTLTATAESRTINNSDMSNKLCRTWRLDKIDTYYKDKKTGKSEQTSVTLEQILQYDDDCGEEVIFTKAGTYMVKYHDGTLDIALWAWVNESTGKACYSWDGKITETNKAEDIINISFSGNQLIVVEEWDDEYEYEKETYYFNEVR